MLAWLEQFLIRYPELALFLVIAAGYWIGSFKIGAFSLGPVTGALFAGLFVGQFAYVPVSGMTKSFLFLLFLFGIGYSVGPQFMQSLKRNGLKPVLLAIVVPITGLAASVLVAKALRLDPGFAAGLMSGALSQSAVKWLPMEAEQYITTDLPGFIWNGNIGGSFMTINGRDKYVNGKGNMLIKIMSTIPISNSSGEEIDQGAMMRFLAEIVWSPSAALNDYIQWTYINDTTANATMSNGNRTVSGIFYFDYEGDILGFEGKRYGNFDGHFSLETWFVRILEHKEFNGIRIGNKCEVTWKLKQGDFTWLQLEVTDISYNNTDFIKQKV